MLRIRAHVLCRIEPGRLEMVSHQLVNTASTQPLARAHKQRHSGRQVFALGICQVCRRVKVPGVGDLREDVPHARLAKARALECDRVVHVREGERGVVGLALEEAVLGGKADDVRGGHAVLWIARLERGDASLVGVRRDIAVGDFQRDPHDALLERALCDHLHIPDLVRVGDGEALHVGGVPVRVCQRRHRLDRLARRARPLQRHPDQLPVVEHRAIHPRLPDVGEDAEPAVRRLADDQPLVVGVPHHVERPRRLRDPAQVNA
mmetsp:Transcript_50796/g.116987  ORF Transcript_50796/g.116987 Transcript_50796/m.116987 type:complete len:263 (-) Transcript_50796:185-973(-)